MARLTNRELIISGIPNWTAIKPDMASVEIRGIIKDYKRLCWEAEGYVHTNVSDKELVSAFIKYCAKNFGKERVAPLKSVPDYKLSIPGKYAYLSLKGVVITEATATYLKNQFEELVQSYATPVDVVAEPKQGRVISIQERMRDQIADVCGEWEGMVDDIVTGKKVELDKFDAFRDMQQNGSAIKAAHARMIHDAFAPMKAEIQEVIAGECEQLNEGYARHKPKVLAKLLTFYDKITTACDTLINAGKVVRKTRKKKAPNKDKQVKNLKYKAQEPKLGLASINPISIVGASMLWTYDVQKRKLAVYNATDASGLVVKGAAILNYDEGTSFQKTVRKPELLKGSDRLARTKLQKLFEGIRGVAVKVRPRVSADTILIKVF